MISLGIQAPSPGTTLSSLQDSGLPAPPATDLKVRLQHAVGERLEVLEPVAEGGMATLFQLRHRRHGGLFVAKTLHADIATRAEVIEAFRREAIHAARLGDHPNAIPIVDSGEDAGLHFLLMPFVEGEDLDQLLQQNGPLSRTEALHFAAQISSLLCHAESHGITHCDLAPGNLRLDAFGRYRVMDFGVSHAADDASARPLGGTPLYTSPEQLRGELPDVRADMYALGLVLAEVLTGAPVLKASSLPELRAQHLAGTWSFPETLTADPLLLRLLRRMTATDRDRRFGSAFELSGALAAMGFERPEFHHRQPDSSPPQAPQDSGGATRATDAGSAAGRRSRLSL